MGVTDRTGKLSLEVAKGDITAATTFCLGIRAGVALALHRPQSAEYWIQEMHLRSINQSPMTIEALVEFELMCIRYIFNIPDVDMLPIEPERQ